MKTRLIGCLLVLFLPLLLPAQRILLLEKKGNPRPERIYIGDRITYRLAGEDDWLEAEIYDLQEEQQLIVLEDRYVPLARVADLRFERSFARPAGLSLITFGLGWSAFAAVGYATDGDPTTRYSWGDAAVTATSTGLGFLIQKLFGNRRVRLGKQHRLRVIDVSFQ